MLLKAGSFLLFALVERLMHGRILHHLALWLAHVDPVLLCGHLEELGLVQAEVFHVLGVKLSWILDIIFLGALRHRSLLDLCAFFLV